MPQTDRMKIAEIQERYMELPESQVKKDMGVLLEALGMNVPRGTKERSIKFQVWFMKPGSRDMEPLDITAAGRPQAKELVQQMYPGAIIGKITLARSKPLLTFEE